MSRAAIMSLALLIRLGSTPAVQAGEPTDTSELASVPATLSAYYANGPAPDRLAYTMDLWCDATLKGDKKAEQRYEQEIFAFLERDIAADEQLVDACTRQAVEELYGPLVRDSSNLVVVDSGYRPVVSPLLFAQARDLFERKKAVFDALKESDAFSNKYRLLGDYIQLLRRELGLPKLKLAASGKSPIGSGSGGGSRQN